MLRVENTKPLVINQLYLAAEIWKREFHMRRLHTALLSTVAPIAGLSSQSASAADLAIRAPVAPVVVVSRWEGAFVSFSAGGN
jgi:hypothetical protein